MDSGSVTVLGQRGGSPLTPCERLYYFAITFFRSDNGDVGDVRRDRLVDRFVADVQSRDLKLILGTPYSILDAGCMAQVLGGVGGLRALVELPARGPPRRPARAGEPRMPPRVAANGGFGHDPLASDPRILQTV